MREASGNTNRRGCEEGVMSVIHQVTNVWNKAAGTWRYWCLDCGREGALRGNEEEANEDGVLHAYGVHR